MKSDTIMRSFTARDGHAVVLRRVRWDDIHDLLDLINALIEENAYIILNTKVKKEQEADWLGRYLAEIENGKRIGVAAEVDGHVVGNSEVTLKSGAQSHVGELGIIIKTGYRDGGIGTEMIRILIEESRKRRLKLLVLRLFADNDRARHVYEKLGFRETGRVSGALYRSGRYCDEVTMALDL